MTTNLKGDKFAKKMGWVRKLTQNCHLHFFRQGNRHLHVPKEDQESKEVSHQTEFHERKVEVLGKFESNPKVKDWWNKIKLNQHHKQATPLKRK